MHIGHLRVMSPPPNFNPAALPPWIRGRVVEGTNEQLTLRIDLDVDSQGTMLIWTTLAPDDALVAVLPKDELDQLLAVSLPWPSFGREEMPEPDEVKAVLRARYLQ